jgi:hypothetical protein
VLFHFTCNSEVVRKTEEKNKLEPHLIIEMRSISYAL